MFVELLACKKLLPYLVRLLGADIKLLTSHLIYREPREPQNGEAVNAGWHRDFIQAQRSLGHEKIPRLDIKVAFCLNDLQEDNSGGTLFIPGSHKLKEGLQIPSKKLPEGVVEPHLKKGDCVIFENRTWHAGGLNLSKNTRKVVMFGYTYTWINSYDFDSQPDSIIAKAKELYGDVGLQLLGALPSPVEFDYNYQDKPLIEWAKDNNVSTYREYNK
jgi:ectoine hydroxylase-related dioxygenase (phytanoyl-CoA dioxygenase family)